MNINAQAYFLNSGRLLVNNNTFYCGSSSNLPCQLALKSDIPNVTQYVHPSEKQCNYSINSDWVRLSTFRSLPAYPPASMKNYLFGLMVVTVTFPATVTMNSGASSGYLFLYYSPETNDAPGLGICSVSYSSSTRGGTGTTSDTRTQTGKIVYFPYTVEGKLQMLPYTTSGTGINSTYEMGMACLTYEYESSGIPLNIREYNCTGSLSSVNGTFYGIIPIK